MSSSATGTQRAARKAALERDKKAREEAACKEEEQARHFNMYDNPRALDETVPLVGAAHMAHGDASKSKFDRLVTAADLVADVDRAFPHLLLALAEELVHVWAAAAAKAAPAAKAAADKAWASAHTEALALVRSTPKSLQHFLLHGWPLTPSEKGPLRVSLDRAWTARDEASWTVNHITNTTERLRAKVDAAKSAEAKAKVDAESVKAKVVEAETDLADQTEETEAEKQDCLAVLAKSDVTIWAVGVLWVGLLAMEFKPEPEVAAPKAPSKKPSKKSGNGVEGGAAKKKK